MYIFYKLNFADGNSSEAEDLSQPVSSQPKKSDNSSLFLSSSSVAVATPDWKWGDINLDSGMDGETEALLRLKEGGDEESLFDDSSEVDGFNRSKLVVGSIDSERDSIPASETGSDSKSQAMSESQEERTIESGEFEHSIRPDETSSRTFSLQSSDSASLIQIETFHSVSATSSQSHPGARLSIHSTDSPEEGSERKSSESVEILGSSASSSPESDMLRSASEAAIKKTSLQINMPSGEITSKEVVSHSHSSPESVEVIPESLTSPSSVEVLGSSRTSSSYTSPTDPEHTLVARVASSLNAELQNALSKYHEGQITSVFSSAPVTPVSEEGSKSLDLASIDSAEGDSVEKVSPESVEVIPEEEASYAESMHSSTSASSTTTTTIMEPKSEIEIVKSGTENEAKAVSVAKCIESEGSLSDKTMLDSGGTELMESSSDTVMPSDKEADPITVEPHTETVDLATESSSLVSVHISDVSDQSGKQDDMEMVKEVPSVESQTSSESGVLNTSSYVRTMLADAMMEKEDEKEAAREQSPISSER